MRTQYRHADPYLTKDGSIIRELMHPAIHGNRNQSLAEATVPSGTTTELHLHNITEEIYYILDGKGKMTLGNESFQVDTGDTICIPPKTPHQISNTESSDLVFLCLCSPAYSHDDTVLL